MAIFKGAGVAIVTPFYDNYEVNYKKLEELINMQIAAGTDAIIICGTTGESATLTMQEHKEVIRHCVRYVNGRVPVIAGTGSNCTETAIELSKDAEKDGADALLIVTPYYNKSTQKGLIEHYSMIAESVKLPIIMYNVPSRTGCNIQPATAVEIAKRNPNVVAIKDAVGDLSVTATMVYLSGQEGNCMDIYSGNHDQIVPIMSVGGLGIWTDYGSKGALRIHVGFNTTVAKEFCYRFVLFNGVSVHRRSYIEARDDGQDVLLTFGYILHKNTSLSIILVALNCGECHFLPT